MKNLVFPILFLFIAACATPKLGVIARVDGKIEAPRNQVELSELRLALYITEHLSKHGKVFEKSDYGKHTLKLLVIDAEGLSLIETGSKTSSAMKKYLRKMFSSNNFKAPLESNYKLGETIVVHIILEHN
jgi:hypothetical protein